MEAQAVVNLKIPSHPIVATLALPGATDFIVAKADTVGAVLYKKGLGDFDELRQVAAVEAMNKVRSWKPEKGSLKGHVAHRLEAITAKANVRNARLIRPPRAIKKKDLLPDAARRGEGFDAVDKTGAGMERMRRSDLGAALKPFLERLPAQEQLVITRHYGIGCEPESLASIAGGCDVSPERIRQVREKALDRIRHMGAKSALRGFYAPEERPGGVIA